MLQRSKAVKDLKTYLKISEHINNRQDIITDDDLKHIKTDLFNLHEEVPVSIAKALRKKKGRS